MDADASKQAFSAQLAALRRQFAANLSSRLDVLQQLAESGPALTPAMRDALHAQLHNLVGSAGTFGFSELSRQGRELMQEFKEWLGHGTLMPAAQWADWHARLLGLRQHAEVADDAGASPVRTRRIWGGGPARDSVRIVLVEPDLAVAAELVRGLGPFGYELSHCASLHELGPLLQSGSADVLLLELPVSIVHDAAQADLFLAQRQGLCADLPTIFLTDSTEFEARLLAARANGDACLVRPIDTPTVADHIELLMRQREQPPYRVLVVEDDTIVAEHYRLTLSAAGILVECVSEAAAVWPALQALHPDLLLLNLRMPGCSGADLARAIRYDAAWQGLPIVYLSAESDVEMQIDAMEHGADDFLLKPIVDVQLVASVRTRAARARRMAELMSQDSLTGLLKHAAIKERLSQELDRATRHGKEVSIAMVDIDHFKRVNDQWGHPVGDHVIRSLGQLLRQRLRRQDSVGRYGGEEFLVILPDCSAMQAERLLSDIRQRFAQVAFAAPASSFQVTISAGIASNEQFRQPAELLAAADAALYQAKADGRNLVRQAGRQGAA